MLVPIIAGLSAIYIVKKLTEKKGVITPERQKIYDNAMASLADPAKLRELADVFQKEGLKVQADMLRKRAALRELPEDVRKQRTEIFKKALQSKDKEAVAKVADAFEKEGAVGAAQRLREYLAGLV